VALNSTLTSGLIVEPSQIVLFTCISTGSGITNWYSDEYIGTDGLPLQIVAAGNTTIVYSNSDPNTIASRISVTNVKGEIVIVSELRIIISSLYFVATVSCDNGDRQLRRSITFSMSNATTIIMHADIDDITLYIKYYSNTDSEPKNAYTILLLLVHCKRWPTITNIVIWP
jgi:hypothetical protein